MRPRLAGALGFLEAAYAWERDDHTWLAGLVEAAVKVCGARSGVSAREEFFQLPAIHALRGERE